MLCMSCKLTYIYCYFSYLHTLASGINIIFQTVRHNHKIHTLPVCRIMHKLTVHIDIDIDIDIDM